MTRRKTLRERFWAKVDMSDADGCWPWTANRFKDGYGQFKVAGRPERASRVAWILTHDEPLPEDIQVLHACDNPPCCRPDHLSRGTHLENMADMTRKKRRHGQVNGKAVLSDDAVNEIRRRYSEGNVTQQALATEFGVTNGYVSKLVRGFYR